MMPRRIYLVCALLGLSAALTASVTLAAQESSTLYPPITPENAAQIAQVAAYGEGWIGGPMAWSPDGSTLAVAGSAALWIYDTSDWDAPPVSIPASVVADVNYSPDGSRLAFADDAGIHLLDADGNAITVVEGRAPLDFSPDGSLLAAGESRGIQLLDAASGEWVAGVIGQVAPQTGSLDFSPDGLTLLVSSVSPGSCMDFPASIIDLWPVDEMIARGALSHVGAERVVLYNEDTSVRGALFTPEGDEVVFEITGGDAEPGVYLLPLAGGSGRLAQEGTIFGGGLSFSRDGSRFAYALGQSYGRGVRVLDRAGGEIIAEFPVSAWIEAVALDAEGARVAAAWETGFSAWEVESGSALAEISTRVTFFSAIDGTRGVIVHDDGSAALIDLSDGREIADLGEGFVSARFSRDGSRMIVTRLGDAPLEVWDAVSGQPISTIDADAVAPDLYLLLSDDGVRALTSHQPDALAGATEVIVWDTASGAVLTRLTVDALVALTGLHIVERTDHGTLRHYDSRTGEFVDESAPLNVHPDFLDNFLSLISADGRYVAYQEPREAGRGRPIDVWDFEARQEIRVADDALMRSFAAGENLLFYEGYVGSSEASRLAVYDLEAGEARILRTYDTWQYTGPIDYSPANGVVTVGIESETGCPGQGTRTEVWRIDGETTELLTTIDTDEDTYTRGVTFSPDGAVMVVQQGEDRLVIMETLSGQALATLGGYSARFTPDGTRLLIDGRDRRTQVWAVAD